MSAMNRVVPIVIKQITRSRIRSLLTVAGIAVAMFLFCVVEAMREGVHEATVASAGDTTLVVDAVQPGGATAPRACATRAAQRSAWRSSTTCSGTA